jgi:hypothetical protein
VVSPQPVRIIDRHVFIFPCAQCVEAFLETVIVQSGLVYFSGIFTPKRCGDMWGFGVHPILSNPLKYSFPKILYHDEEFLI